VPDSAPMTEQSPDPGWNRLKFKSKFGAGRDFEVTDVDDNRVMFVDGKIGMKPKAEVRDAADQVVFTVEGRFGGIPKQMTITDAAGTQVAHLKAKMFSPIKSRMTMNLADGRVLDVEGSLMEKNYQISSDGQPVANITQKWVTVRDQYTVDFIDTLEPGLVMAIIWAIDRWVERD
jgi:uncharacterized protein YxjI